MYKLKNSFDYILKSHLAKVLKSLRPLKLHAAHFASLQPSHNVWSFDISQNAFFLLSHNMKEWVYYIKLSPFPSKILSTLLIPSPPKTRDLPFILLACDSQRLFSSATISNRSDYWTRKVRVILTRMIRKVRATRVTCKSCGSCNTHTASHMICLTLNLRIM